jgi:hypothetical protein
LNLKIILLNIFTNHELQIIQIINKILAQNNSFHIIDFQMKKIEIKRIIFILLNYFKNNKKFKYIGIFEEEVNNQLYTNKAIHTLINVPIYILIYFNNKCYKIIIGYYSTFLYFNIEKKIKSIILIKKIKNNSKYISQYKNDLPNNKFKIHENNLLNW